MPLVVTPDGRRYLSMAAGNREPNPYNLRFGLPWVLGQSFLAWLCCTWVSIAACGVLTALLAQQRGLGMHESVVAGLLWLGLPSTRFLARAPVLVDGTGTALALGSALLAPIEPIAAGLLVLLGACIWEKTPVFAALFAWNPWLLGALAVPALRRMIVKAPPPTQRDRALAQSESKIATGFMSRASVWRAPDSLLWPWGACLAALWEPDLWWLAALGVAHAQLFVAYDTVRLAQNAAPAVCIAAAGVIPEAWVVPVLVFHWFNPKMGTGV